MIDKLIAFYKAEQALLNKSDSYMKKVYKNRIETNLKGDREIILFIVDKLGEQYFAKKLNKEYVDKLLYGFNIIAGEKELKSAILNNVEFRKSNLI